MNCSLKLSAPSQIGDIVYLCRCWRSTMNPFMIYCQPTLILSWKLNWKVMDTTYQDWHRCLFLIWMKLILYDYGIYHVGSNIKLFCFRYFHLVIRIDLQHLQRWTDPVPEVMLYCVSVLWDTMLPVDWKHMVTPCFLGWIACFIPLNQREGIWWLNEY